MKKTIALLLALLLALPLLPALAEEEPDPLSLFAIRHGHREEKVVALTVDDSFDLDMTWQIRDMFQELGVVGTFFPVGIQLHEEDREEWQKVLDYGNEIGSHNSGHYKMGSSKAWDIISALGHFQQTLDATLGYHYQINCFRPPFGNIVNADGNGAPFRKAVQKYGYQHVILWEVSRTDPDEAYRRVKNGSILLFHARHKDMVCMQNLIPRLQADGFEFVTVSQLAGFGENVISPEPYVYNKADFQ